MVNDKDFQCRIFVETKLFYYYYNKKIDQLNKLL